MKISSLSKVVLFIGLSAIPLISSAQSGTQVQAGMGTLNTLIKTITGTIAASIATLLFSAALIAFFVGVVQYIWGAREGVAADIAKGNLFMKWSLVALFVMFSVYGIIRFGQNFLCGGPCSNEITIPDINFKSGGSNAAGGVTPGGTASPGSISPGGSVSPSGSSNTVNPGGTSDTRSTDTNYSCPSGKYGDFGECLPGTSSGAATGDVDPESVNGFY